MNIDPDLSIIMKIVDENKEKLSDGAYLKICNSLQCIHYKLKKIKKFRINRNIIFIGYASVFSICKLIKKVRIQS